MERWFTQDLHGATSQKTAFFMCTTMLFLKWNWRRLIYRCKNLLSARKQLYLDRSSYRIVDNVISSPNFVALHLLYFNVITKKDDGINRHCTHLIL
jgi:hypothetical protein